MEPMTGNVENVARLIHLAVAPVFLLTAVATTLLVLANRLGRIVDRGRLLESRGQASQKELLVIEQRAHLIYRGLTFGVSAAISVCLLMTSAFVGEVFHFNLWKAVAGLFILALFAYTAALVCMLREVFLAVGSFRLGIHPSKS